MVVVRTALEVVPLLCSLTTQPSSRLLEAAAAASTHVAATLGLRTGVRWSMLPDRQAARVQRAKTRAVREEMLLLQELLRGRPRHRAQMLSLASVGPVALLAFARTQVSIPSALVVQASAWVATRSHGLATTVAAGARAGTAAAEARTATRTTLRAAAVVRRTSTRVLSLRSGP